MTFDSTFENYKWKRVKCVIFIGSGESWVSTVSSILALQWWTFHCWGWFWKFSRAASINGAPAKGLKVKVTSIILTISPIECRFVYKIEKLKPYVWYIRRHRKVSFTFWRSFYTTSYMSLKVSLKMLQSIVCSGVLMGVWVGWRTGHPSGTYFRAGYPINTLLKDNYRGASNLRIWPRTSIQYQGVGARNPPLSACNC